MDREAQRLQTEMATAKFASQKPSAASAVKSRSEFETVSQRVSALTEEIMQTRESNRIQATSGDRNGRAISTPCARNIATALGKRGSLEAVIAEHGYSTESVRRLFQSGVMEGGLAPVGVLADFLEVRAAI